jgi:hypothetical protein
VLLRQFTRPLIYALLASAAAFALCDVLEGVVVLAVVVLDARVGSVQEYRAGRAVEELDVLGRPHDALPLPGNSDPDSMAGRGMGNHTTRTGLVERPLLGNGHGGCGRRLGETHRWKHRQDAPGRPHGPDRCAARSR